MYPVVQSLKKEIRSSLFFLSCVPLHFHHACVCVCVCVCECVCVCVCVLAKIKKMGTEATRKGIIFYKKVVFRAESYFVFNLAT